MKEFFSFQLFTPPLSSADLTDFEPWDSFCQIRKNFVWCSRGRVKVCSEVTGCSDAFGKSVNGSNLRLCFDRW